MALDNIIAGGFFPRIRKSISAYALGLVAATFFSCNDSVSSSDLHDAAVPTKDATVPSRFDLGKFHEVDDVFRRRLVYSIEVESTGVRDIYITNGVGTPVRRLVSIDGEESQLAWSPRGDTLAAVVARSFCNPWTIYVMDVNGDNIRDLTPIPDTKGVTPEGKEGCTRPSMSPSWSADGSLIAFSSAREEGGIWRPYIMNSDGTNQRKISDRDSYNPVISPDGTRVLFVAAGEDGLPDIYIVDADGSNERALTAEREGGYFYPSWSPDGQTILYTGGGGIAVMNPDGSDPRVLAEGSTGRYSPDGRMIAYHTGFGATSEIFVMNANGSNQRNLTNNNDNDLMPDWSPDSKVLAYSSAENGKGMNLWVVDVESGVKTQFTDFLREIGFIHLDWHPNQQWEVE